ncbi:MAG TPA: GtrA family protein [Xanthomonadaceae bacterium]|nr:GtrA family protein [Xanthomonadaceae bacterium]
MLARQLLHFCLAGAAGFVVDAGIVQALVGGLAADPYLARIPAIAAAILVTWQYNRHVTFRSARHRGVLAELGRYLLGNAAGLVVNYGAYAGVVAGFETARQWPILAVAAGALAGLLVNFVSARFLVFSAPR